MNPRLAHSSIHRLRLPVDAFEYFTFAVQNRPALPGDTFLRTIVETNDGLLSHCRVPLADDPNELDSSPDPKADSIVDQPETASPKPRLFVRVRLLGYGRKNAPECFWDLLNSCVADSPPVFQSAAPFFAQSWEFQIPEYRVAWREDPVRSVARGTLKQPPTFRRVTWWKGGFLDRLLLVD